MNRINTQNTLLNVLLSLMTVVVMGCNVNIGGCCCGSQERFERTEENIVPMQGITAIDVDTLFGSVTVEGAETEDCRIQAGISAGAPTEEEARQIAEQTKIKIEPLGGTLKISVEKPKLENNRSVGVSFDITIPKTTAAQIHSSYGSVKLSDLAADVKAKTSFASVSCSDVTGDVDLKTSYGSIDCDNIDSDFLKAHTSFSSITCSNVTAPVDLKTSYGNIRCHNLTSSTIEAQSSFGSIDIDCSDQSGPEPRVDVSTSYGSIEFKAPTGFSGTVKAKTSYGSIKTLLPITVSGEIGKDTLSGVVGTGRGQLNLKTSFGSIRIK